MYLVQGSVSRGKQWNVSAKLAETQKKILVSVSEFDMINSNLIQLFNSLNKAGSYTQVRL